MKKMSLAVSLLARWNRFRGMEALQQGLNRATSKSKLLSVARGRGLALLLSAIFAGAGAMAPTAQAQVGGPVALVGIDAEDGGPGGHGPIANYVQLANALYNAGIKGTDVLVIGGGKSATDAVTRFWNAIDAASSFSVTYVNGPAAIAAADFTPYRMVAVVSDSLNTPSGGLNSAEDAAIDARFNDVASHINTGGGVLGFSSSQHPAPYGYIAGAAPVTATVIPAGYDNITPTPEGIAVGITDALDVCCWHDVFTTWPAFLDVLARVAAGEPGADQVAAVGGFDVIIPGFVLSPATAENPAGTPHTLTITATTTVGGTTTPQPGVAVTFTVTPSGGSTPVPAAGSCTTGPDGMCTFTYTSPTPGNDTITARGMVAGQLRTATATKTWVCAPPQINCPSDITACCGDGLPRLDDDNGDDNAVCAAVVTYTVTATSDCDPNPTVVCVPPSGSIFLEGTTPVTCTAIDSAGNVSMCMFNVIVKPCEEDDDDFDEDGERNDEDADDDNDGERDEEDADDDNDGERDEADADDDNDGIKDLVDSESFRERQLLVSGNVGGINARQATDHPMFVEEGTLLVIGLVEAANAESLSVEIFDPSGLLVGRSAPAPQRALAVATALVPGTYTMRVRNTGSAAPIDYKAALVRSLPW